MLGRANRQAVWSGRCLCTRLKIVSGMPQGLGTVLFVAAQLFRLLATHYDNYQRTLVTASGDQLWPYAFFHARESRMNTEDVVYEIEHFMVRLLLYNHDRIANACDADYHAMVHGIRSCDNLEDHDPLDLHQGGEHTTRMVMERFTATLASVRLRSLLHDLRGSHLPLAKARIINRVTGACLSDELCSEIAHWLLVFRGHPGNLQLGLQSACLNEHPSESSSMPPMYSLSLRPGFLQSRCTCSTDCLTVGIRNSNESECADTAIRFSRYSRDWVVYHDRPPQSTHGGSRCSCEMRVNTLPFEDFNGVQLGMRSDVGMILPGSRTTHPSVERSPWRVWKDFLLPLIRTEDKSPIDPMDPLVTE